MSVYLTSCLIVSSLCPLSIFLYVSQSYYETTASQKELKSHYYDLKKSVS